MTWVELLLWLLGAVFFIASMIVLACLNISARCSRAEELRDRELQRNYWRTMFLELWGITGGRPGEIIMFGPDGHLAPGWQRIIRERLRLSEPEHDLEVDRRIESRKDDIDNWGRDARERYD